MSDAAAAFGLANRLALYGIDEGVQQALKDLGPIAAPKIAGAVDEFILRGSRLPHTAKMFADHGALIRKLEIEHFARLFDHGFDDAYVEALRDTIRREVEVGVETRARTHATNLVYTAALAALERKHRFSVRKVA